MKFLKEKLKLRVYQQTILANSFEKNSLVVLPTGLGKTFIAIGLAGLAHEKGVIVMMAPTKPLCVQHQRTFSEFFDPSDKLVTMTGAVRPDERKKLWRGARMVFCTPQTLERDILRRHVDLSKVSLMIFDEAHRATGDYSYVWIADQYKKSSQGNTLALSASPASSKERMDEICKNLKINNVEVKTETDADVVGYVKEKKVEIIEVELPPEITEIKSLLELCLATRLRELKEDGVIPSYDIRKTRKTDLLALQKKLASELSSKNMEKYNHISLVASCLKIQHLLMMVQTQSIESVVEFFKKLEKQAKKVKASKRLLMDWNFKKAVVKAYDAAGKGIEHPKLPAIRELVGEEVKKGSKIIIFASYRSSIEMLVNTLETVEGAKPRRFIGQKEGMSQREQVAAIERFKEGKYNVLVCSSIGEEGLHLPALDVGIFYEPVGSALRSVQRRGRIGRTEIGRVFMLITKNTIDEGYYWAAKRKERRMHELLTDLKDEIDNGKQITLGDFNN